ncbi:MAG: hypothetical protein NTV94_17980 [Planctomycetota bacterium]|nr:hypothetical protein [Planctomycetota bacterium]
MNLSQFLQLSHWQLKDAAEAANMTIALAFFTREVSAEELCSPVPDPSPWLTGAGGTPLRIMEFMQAIDFGNPLVTAYLPAGWRLQCYRTPGSRSSNAGRYYTELGTPGVKLAIPGDQFVSWQATLVRPASCLISTVGDAYIDWARQRGIPARYGGGGARQYFLPGGPEVVALSR